MARVLALGNFDLLHEGHLGFFRKMRQLAHPDGRVIVGVNPDKFSIAYKRAPIRDEQTRAEDVRATGLADEVFIQPGFDGQAASILSIAPDVFVAAMDWADEERYSKQLQIPSLAWFDEHGILLVFVTRSGSISTTDLIET